MKDTLQRYLRNQRQAMLWKVEGLSEREARMPLTPTGTNLLGLLKHVAYVEAGYFGDAFGRPVPDFAGWSGVDEEVDDGIDMWATESESIQSVTALYRRVCAHSDETIAAHALEDTGHVSWWGPSGEDAALGHLLVHVTAETARHAGHADILRELTDGAAGLREGSTNLPESYDWPAYVARLKAIAESF